MKIVIAGEDQTREMESVLRTRGEALNCEFQPAPGSLDVGLLGALKDPGEFDRRFLEHLRNKSQVDTQPFAIPRKPGLGGTMMAAVRRFLWKLLRYQHDRMSTRQNRINAWIISALEHQTERLWEENRILRERMDRLAQPDLPPKGNPSP